MKVLRSSHAEVVHVKGLEHAECSACRGVMGSGEEVLESNLHGLVDVLNDSLAGVSGEVGGVEAQLEAVRASVEDLDGAGVINLGHTADLNELDEVTVLVSVALILVHVHGGVLTLFDAANNELTVGLTILVSDSEVGAIVKESVGGDTHGL